MFNIPLQIGSVTSPITVSGDMGQCCGSFTATIFYGPSIPELHEIPPGVLFRLAYT
jgi:hypothetical protein